MSKTRRARKYPKRKHRKSSSQHWRSSNEWVRARRQCLREHDYTCYITGERLPAKDLDVHHVEDASNNKELRYTQSNLVPIKREFHQHYHTAFLHGFKKPTSRFSLNTYRLYIRMLMTYRTTVDFVQIVALIILNIVLIYTLVKML